MGLSGIAKGALLILGVGILAEKFKAGPGLAGLGVGVTSIVAAPGIGTGLGLSGTAQGLRDLGESIGDIGRGFGELFKAIPSVPGVGGAPSEEYAAKTPIPLIPESGGAKTQLLAGGGGNVITPVNVYRDYDYAGGPWTFHGAPSTWRTKEAALKNLKIYREAHGMSNVGMTYLNV